MPLSLLDKDILLLDGGLGTTLEDQHGIKFTSKDNPLWSSHLLISSPETLLNVQTDFANAGADVILTATYQASFEGIQNTPDCAAWQTSASFQSTMESSRLMQSAIGISNKAITGCGRPGLVALSLGAYGATLIPSQEYTGDYGNDYSSPEGTSLFLWHYERLRAFFNNTKDIYSNPWRNIDFVAFETLPRLSEIRAVRSAMFALACLDSAEGPEDVNDLRGQYSKPYWISCVFPNEDDNLPDGNTIEEALKVMLFKDPEHFTTESGNLVSNPARDMSRSTALPLPYAIGINCTKIYKISRLILKFEQAAESLNLQLPRLVVYPDGAGGLKYDTTSQKWVGDGSDVVPWDEQVVEIVKEVKGRGRWKGILVGGCCKTTPEHIKNLRKRLDDMLVL